MAVVIHKHLCNLTAGWKEKDYLKSNQKPVALGKAKHITYVTMRFVSHYIPLALCFFHFNTVLEHIFWRCYNNIIKCCWSTVKLKKKNLIWSHIMPASCPSWAIRSEARFYGPYALQVDGFLYSVQVRILHLLLYYLVIYSAARHVWFNAGSTYKSIVRLVAAAAAAQCNELQSLMRTYISAMLIFFDREAGNR